MTTITAGTEQIRSDRWLHAGRGLLWAWAGAVAAPVVGLAIALPAHYPWGFATIGHLGLIYLATAIFVIGALLALKALGDQQNLTRRDRS
jgi:hypothetical protein